MSMLRGAKVLVTGASGFIGGRLVDRLILEEGADVRALVRDFSHAAWLSRVPVEMIAGDVTDAAAVDRAVAGCTHVFHCAHSGVGIWDLDHAVNVTGTEALFRACVAHGVKRLVHLSTVAVMGPTPPDGADETFVCRKTGLDSYSDTKLEGEELALRYFREQHLPVVILRPTAVYGPRSPAWTLGPLARIRAGIERLINGGGGLAHPVHVDNMVDAMLLAATADGVTGEVFIISDGVPVTWREFYSHHASWLGVELRSRPAWRAHLWESLMGRWERAAPLLVRFLFTAENDKMRRQAVSFSRQILFGGRPRLQHIWVDFFAHRGRLNIDKARAKLGYRPRVALAEGMEETRRWLVDQGLIEDRASRH